MISQFDPWLHKLGFRFNPFEHLEASSDRFLVEYIVGHETFALAWNEVPSLVYAKAGGGKTAMRIYTARTCWSGLGSNHPFPIPYYLPAYFNSGSFFELEDHRRKIVAAWAASLMTGLVFRPERVLTASLAARRTLARILNSHLPRPLEHYLGILQETGVAYSLPPLLDPAYVLPQPPERQALLEMCAAMQACLSPAKRKGPNFEQDFEELAEITLGELGFGSIFLLMDGIDAFPELSPNHALSVQAIQPLLLQAPAWAQRRIFLKGFLPLELQESIEHSIKPVLSAYRIASLNWSVTDLDSMIRRRVYTASDGYFGSLDALSSPALRDIEMDLAQFCQPLPRELLVLVQRVLYVCFGRTGRKQVAEIEPGDIERAKGWYQSQQEQLARLAQESGN